jgi:hypothetical protein
MGEVFPDEACYTPSTYVQEGCFKSLPKKNNETSLAPMAKTVVKAI